MRGEEVELSQGQAREQTPEELANQRYWHSDLGVNQIAEELGLSKSRLYEAIVPQPAGVMCPICDRELAYPNRTARHRGEPECPNECEVAATLESSGLLEPMEPRTLLAGLALGGVAVFLLVRLLRR
jgi:hypothetical protein